MKYFVTGANDKVYEVDLTQEPDGSYTLVHEGETIHVDLQELKQGALYSILMNQRSHDVLLERKNDQLEVTMEGRLYRFGVQNKIEKSLEQAGGGRIKKKGPPVLKAEMPGVVVEVKVKPGDEVEAGDILLVIEAMKMQNEITAPAAATIKGVSVSDGQLLTDGDELVSLNYK